MCIGSSIESYAIYLFCYASLHKYVFFKNFSSISLLQDAVKMNQLQNLLHDSLIATDHVHHCAIIRRKDCNVRASSVGFNVSTSVPHVALRDSICYVRVNRAVTY